MISKNKEKESILKSSFFLKLFGIPSICWLIVSLIVMFLPDESGDDPITWIDFIIECPLLIAIWFAISFVIVLIINEVKKNKPKTKIVKQIQYITKQDEKVVAKPKKSNDKKKSNSKCLHTCESIVDGYEYKKMAKYFPNRMYWVFVIRGVFINLIITAYIAITSQSWVVTLIFFIVYQIYLLIYYKVRLEPISEKVFNARKKHGEVDTNYETEFYEDYFIRKGKKISLTIDYSEISRCVENDTNFYLEYDARNMIIILQKNRCDLELINFIRNKFKNLENHLGDNSNYAGVKKYHNPKFIKTSMIILFIITLCSLWGALWSVILMNEINPTYGFNFTKNTWIFWCWLPLPVLSIILGFKFNKAGFKCTKNIVAGFIIGFLLLVYGSSCLMPTFSAEYKNINDYKEYIDASIPSNGVLEIQDWNTYFDEDKTDYTIINAYYDKENVDNLVSSIEKSDNWILSTKMESKLKILLPSEFRSNNYVYYSIYNKTTKEYNTIPSTSGNYDIYAMKYDKAQKQLSIHKFKYSYK